MARGAGGTLVIVAAGVGAFWLYKKGYFSKGSAPGGSSAAGSALGKAVQGIADSLKKIAQGPQSSQPKGSTGSSGSSGGTGAANNSRSGSNAGPSLGGVVDLSWVADIPDRINPPGDFTDSPAPDFGGTYNPGTAGGGGDTGPYPVDINTFGFIPLPAPLPPSAIFGDGGGGASDNSRGGDYAPDEFAGYEF